MFKILPLDGVTVSDDLWLFFYRDFFVFAKIKEREYCSCRLVGKVLIKQSLYDESSRKRLNPLFRWIHFRSVHFFFFDKTFQFLPFSV